MIEVSIFLIALASSFIGLLIPGVASALSVSTLILMGIPIQLAKAIYQIGNLGINLWALLPLLRTQKLRWDLIIPLSFLALVGWFLWGKILVDISPEVLLKLTGWFMIVLLLVNILIPSLWLITSEVSKKRKFTGFFGYFVLNILYSVLPMGTGILFQFLHTFFFRVTNLQARLMGCFLTTPFVVWFIFPLIQSGVYDIRYMIIFSIGGYIGGFIGAKSGIKLGNTWLKKILIGWLFLLGIYFLLFA